MINQAQEPVLRNALSLLERAKPGCDFLGGDGPVNPDYAIGHAIEAIRAALTSSDQPTGDA